MEGRREAHQTKVQGRQHDRQREQERRRRRRVGGGQGQGQVQEEHERGVRGLAAGKKSRAGHLRCFDVFQ